MSGPSQVGDASARSQLQDAANEEAVGNRSSGIRSVAGMFGFRWDERGWSVSTRPLTSGILFALVVLVVYTAIFAKTIREFPYWSAFSNGVDERILYFQTARNFNQYGFMASGFLQDFSTSSDARGHPFVYDHMPAGPEIFVSLLMRVFGERYRLFRVIFGSIFLLGVACYLRFAAMALKAHGLTGAGYALLFLDPNMVLNHADHPMYCAFPFLIFFPLMAIQDHYRTGRKMWLALAAGAVLISSVFMAYQFVILSAIGWVLLRLMKVIRFEKRHVWVFLGMTTLGIGLHVIQNALYLGFSTALTDLRYTLTNRMFGHPTGPELSAFYQSLNVVHHGTHTFAPLGLLRSIILSLEVPAILAVLAVAGGVVVSQLWRRARYDGRADRLEVRWKDAADPEPSAFSILVRFGAWGLLTVAVPLLAFPAYSADYALQGIGQFMVAIFAVLALGLTFRELRTVATEPGSGSSLSRSQVNFLSGAGLLVALLLTVGVAVTRMIKDFSTCARHAKDTRYTSIMKLSEMLPGKLVMTNIYPTVVGFFTRESALGGAEFTAFPEGGPPDPDQAYAKHIRGYEPKKVRPSHYVLFRAFHTGFTQYRDADSLRRLHDQIALGNKVIYEDELYTVFELAY